MKASELKNKGVKLKLGDAEYDLKFDMNTFCELEEVSEISIKPLRICRTRNKSQTGVDLFGSQG